MAKCLIELVSSKVTFQHNWPNSVDRLCIFQNRVRLSSTWDHAHFPTYHQPLLWGIYVQSAGTCPRHIFTNSIVGRGFHRFLSVYPQGFRPCWMKAMFEGNCSRGNLLLHAITNSSCGRLPFASKMVRSRSREMQLIFKWIEIVEHP